MVGRAPAVCAPPVKICGSSGTLYGIPGICSCSPKLMGGQHKLVVVGLVMWEIRKRCAGWKCFRMPCHGACENRYMSFCGMHKDTQMQGRVMSGVKMEEHNGVPSNKKITLQHNACPAACLSNCLWFGCPSAFMSVHLWVRLSVCLAVGQPAHRPCWAGQTYMHNLLIRP